jgi:flagellar protein FlaG
MASVSVSHLIIFIAAMIVASSVAGVLTTTVNDIGDAIDDQGLSVSDDIRSEIEIINDQGADVVNESATPDRVELYVKNTGSTELTTAPDNVDVLLNGQFRTADNVTIVSSDSDVWGRNEVARIEVEDTSPIQQGENRAKVRVDGADDTLIWERDTA